MPRTAAAFLVGSLAIVGLPPLNGFVSEWIMVLGALTAAHATGPVRFAGLAAAAVGLVGALALACFVRLVAVVFLGRGRSGEGVPHEDAPRGMGIGLGALAAACLIIGLNPGVVLTPAVRVAQGLAAATPETEVPLIVARSAVVLPAFGGLILLLVLATWLLRVASRRETRLASGETWTCAFPAQSTRMQYTASSFSAPMLESFPAVTAPERVRDAAGFRTIPADLVLRRVAIPLWGRVRALALSLRPLQQGRVTTYLQYIIWVVLALLAYLSLAPRGASP
jgi:hydrogenase-4 component B